MLNGPRARELTIGKVLVNERAGHTVMVQPYGAQWGGVRIVHRPLYQTPEGYSAEPGPRIAKELVRYEALVTQVETLAGGGALPWLGPPPL